MRYLLCLYLLFSGNLLFGKTGFIPHEYESQGGYSMGLNNGGTVSRTGLGAIRANPGMLAAEKTYELNASYMWPTSGREVYQIGAVDSVTSMLALGVVYTGHRQDYKHPNDATGKDKESAFYDSSLTRRIAAGVGFNFSSVSLGFGGAFVDGMTSSNEKTSGVSLNIGAAVDPFSALRIGASVENLLNNKIKEFSPRFYRVGASYRLFSSLGLNLDYSQRQRVPQENDFESFKSGQLASYMAKDEKTLITSGSFTFKEMVTLSMGYGHSFDETKRNSIAGSVALSKSGLFLSYALRRPYLSKEHYNHTVHATYHVKL